MYPERSLNYFRDRCEPKRLFNLIEFMINDKDGGGTINEDEMME